MPALQTRGFASEKQLKARIVSVKGIRKITKAVYMVASAKLRRTESRLHGIRVFGDSMRNLIPIKDEPDHKGKMLLAAISSDRGLCGGYNSSIAREAKRTIAHQLATGGELSLITFGEKIRTGLDRGFKEHFDVNIVDISKLKVNTFSQVATLSAYISRAQFDYGSLLFNHFKNIVSYEQKKIPLRPLSWFKKNGKDKLRPYHVTGDIEVQQNLGEFRNAVCLWYAMGEGDAAEMASRMNAMQGASKNTNDMLGRLTLQYNRIRQARITTELGEIVAGVVAQED